MFFKHLTGASKHLFWAENCQDPGHTRAGRLAVLAAGFGLQAESFGILLSCCFL
jgi:hypothetical protein